MKNGTKALLLALALIGLHAHADTSYNSGNISNTVKASASVTGAGTSVSHASGSGYATAGANSGTTRATNPNSGTSFISGNTGTEAHGVAYNISTGAGAGSASSVVNANANAASNTQYTAPGQSLVLNGNSASSSGVAVTAGKNQDGYANSHTNGNYYADGKVGSAGQKVDGYVYDNKASNADASAGRVVFSTPVVTNAAAVNANANTIVNVNGSFVDPQ